MDMRDGKVLVVEANPVVSRAIEKASGSLTFTCDTATDGWEAIELLEAGQYAAIVIDTDIPRHSGYGVLTYLREEVGEDTMRNVIAMTSSDRDEVRRKVGETVNVVSKDDAVAAVTRVMAIES
jgi:CheY-like chemotaxis protein